MASDDPVQLLIQRYNRLKVERSGYEREWEDIRKLVRPSAREFYRRGANTTRDTNRGIEIFDGTAPWSLKMLASALHGMMTSPAERWFGLVLKGVPLTLVPERFLEYLELVSDAIYNEYANPKVMFQGSLHELYLDVAGFGTGVMNQEYHQPGGHLVFRTYPMADCVLAENDLGVIDTIFRTINMTGRQIQQKFGFVPETVAKDEKAFQTQQDKEFEVLQAVFPSADRQPGLMNLNKAFTSIYILLQHKVVLSTGGYRSFPYHAPRWEKTAGEVYGDAPAMTCMPEIKGINQVRKTMLKAMQKAVAPPWLVPDEGYMSIVTKPDSLSYYTPGSDPVIALESRAHFDPAYEQTKDSRDTIAKCFHVDWILQQKNNLEMTATEVVDRREEKLSLLSPVAGRLQSELFGPMIKRSYELLLMNGRIPLPPPGFAGPLDILYSSAISRSQNLSKAASIDRYAQKIIPLAQIDPSILDTFSLDGYAREQARLGDVSRSVIRRVEEVAAIRQQRAEAQAAQQASQTGLDTSQSIRNIAEAQGAVAG